MSENKWNFSILGIYILSMVILTIFQTIVILFNPGILDDDALLITFSSSSNLFLYGMLFISFLFVLRKYFKTQLDYFKENKKKIILIIVVGFIGIYVMSIISNVILYLLGVTETSENQEQLTMLLEGSFFDKASLVIFSVIFAPLVEEIVFRKAILNIFHFKSKAIEGSREYKYQNISYTIIAVLMSSLFFGLVHVTSGDFIQIIYYGLLGGVLGIVYVVSGKNIIAPIGVHFILNLIATLLIFL